MVLQFVAPETCHHTDERCYNLDMYEVNVNHPHPQPWVLPPRAIWVGDNCLSIVSTLSTDHEPVQLHTFCDILWLQNHQLVDGKHPLIIPLCNIFIVWFRVFHSYYLPRLCIDRFLTIDIYTYNPIIYQLTYRWGPRSTTGRAVVRVSLARAER
jgi:hypothetical protein